MQRFFAVLGGLGRCEAAVSGSNPDACRLVIRCDDGQSNSSEGESVCGSL